MLTRQPDESTDAYHSRLARGPSTTSSPAPVDRRLYHALLRARENAREKDWPGDVARLQALVVALFGPD